MEAITSIHLFKCNKVPLLLLKPKILIMNNDLKMFRIRLEVLLFVL
jgi:hypothetical protein